MTAKSFADSNVVLYTIGKDARKADIARRLIANRPAISAQVVSECVSVCIRKLSFSREQAYAFARTLIGSNRRTVARRGDDRSGCERGDTLSAVALGRIDCGSGDVRAGCETLYSEDLQHGQVFEERVTVLNPFLTDTRV